MRKNDCKDEKEYKTLKALQKEYDEFVGELIDKYELTNVLYAKFLINTILCDFDKMKMTIRVFNTIFDAAKEDYKIYQDEKLLASEGGKS